MSRLDAIDLSTLTPPDVVETLEYEARLAALIADFRTRWPEFSALLESDPVVKLLETVAYLEILLRARVNDAAKAVLLAHAAGADLDHLAALVGTARRVVREADPAARPPVEAEYETDAELRARAQMAWEALSTAGPEGAYVYHALSADGRVRDVGVDSPVPGTVRVTILARDGDGTAPADLVAAVREFLAADDRRPLTDTVEVRGAEILPYRVEAVITCYPGPARAPVIAQARAAAEKTVARLHALGHDVTASALHAALHQPGVQRVDLTEPATGLIVDPHQAAWCREIVLHDGGRDV